VSDGVFLVNAVGVGAGLCSMVSFIPQIGKMIAERSAKGVSLKMFSVTVTAFILWTTYGLLLKSWPLVVSNGVCLAMALTIVGLRLRFGDGKVQEVDCPSEETPPGSPPATRVQGH
jgi:MtN3 and saliva related transmembrane protein